MAYFSNPSGNITTDFFKQSSKTFYRVSMFKFLVIRSILQMDVDVLYSDSDIILYHNPVPFIQRYPFDSMVFQKDTTVCTGFFYARPTPLTFNLINRSLKHITTKHIGDQSSMRQSFRDMKLESSILPVSQFQSGEVFFASHQYWWDAIDPSIVMMHNNYILGSTCKQYRMLEMNYTSRRVKDPESTLYLTAESLPYEEEALRKELHLLANISNALNRVLIIPPIPCSIGKGYCTIANRELVRCFAEIIEGVKAGYRESVGIEGDDDF